MEEKIQRRRRSAKFFHTLWHYKSKQKNDAEVSAKHNGCEISLIAFFSVSVLNLHPRQA